MVAAGSGADPSPLAHPPACDKNKGPLFVCLHGLAALRNFGISIPHEETNMASRPRSVMRKREGQC